VTYLLALSLLGNVATVAMFLRNLSQTVEVRDKREDLLLTRIQHPEVVHVDRPPIELTEPEEDPRDYAGMVFRGDDE